MSRVDLAQAQDVSLVLVYDIPCGARREKTGPDSHLVSQQHEDHVLLGIFLDLRQPGLYGESWGQSQGWSLASWATPDGVAFLEAFIQVVLLMEPGITQAH